MTVRLALVVAASLIVAGAAVRAADPGPVWLACVEFVAAFAIVAAAGFAVVLRARRVQ